MQRTRALTIFRKLHRTCQKVFKGDVETLQAAREKINSEFKANQNETNTEKIDELLKTAEDCELLIRTTVIQSELVDVEKNLYRMNLREDLAYQENEPPVTEK
ncbi:Complex III assembly factor LYRM7 [Schistosoma japonicum]|uniref:Complex III assembly factor LYRM7 n=1 Tax=Schistosoma japonicum TaxID=6182 RepID=A0A4Z2D643_SCHJA|nr:Complex III assembly factor LYRM7 [Schistosoma japonicum]